MSDSYVDRDSGGDEVDKAIDPENLDDHVIALAEAESGAENKAPPTKEEQVSNRETRLKLLHKYILQGRPIDQIAQQLNVSVATIYKDRKELFRRLREEAKKLDVNELIGTTLAFYNEVQVQSMVIASSDNVPYPTRLASMRTALACKGDSHRFLQAAGVFDVLRYKPDIGKGDNDIGKLIDLTEKLLTTDEGDLKKAGIGLEHLPELKESLEEDVDDDVKLLS